MRPWRLKIWALCPEHPNRDHNPKFTPLSETTSVIPSVSYMSSPPRVNTTPPIKWLPVSNGCCLSVIPPTICWQQIISMIWDHSNDSIHSFSKLVLLMPCKAKFTYCSQSWFITTPPNSFLVIQILIDCQVVPIKILFNVSPTPS